MSDISQTRSGTAGIAVVPGEPRAGEEYLAGLYPELRKLAAWHMSKEAPGQTLQPTALVHEAWLRVQGEGQVGPGQIWQNRRHFFAAAAEAMRRILIDRARRKKAVRHGGNLHRTDFEVQDLPLCTTAPDEELLQVDESLEALAELDPRKAELVKLKYFAGMTLEEAAATMEVSLRTAKRDWAFAKAWLFREIRRRRANDA